MEYKSLFQFLQSEPTYRLNQVKKAVFLDLFEDWQKVTNLPQALREKLNQTFPLLISGKIFSSLSEPTAKALLTLNDGVKIETVLLKHQDGRRTVCVSSQAGCQLNCKFCATGQQGFKRNLTAGEIVDQVVFFSRYLKNVDGGKNHVTNIVFMGMGEPFLNYENVMAAINLLNDKDGLAIGSRKISISTCGITEGIKKLASEKFQVNLAVSLHAPNDELRIKLMPIGQKYPLVKIFQAVDAYIKKTNRQVMFEYLLIQGVNDSVKLAKELAVLMKKPLYLVNLIVYNPTKEFKPPSFRVIKDFKTVLEKAGVKVTQRHSFGQKIQAACGQLAGSD